MTEFESGSSAEIVEELAQSDDVELLVLSDEATPRVILEVLVEELDEIPIGNGLETPETFEDYRAFMMSDGDYEDDGWAENTLRHLCEIYEHADKYRDRDIVMILQLLGIEIEEAEDSKGRLIRRVLLRPEYPLLLAEAAVTLQTDTYLDYAVKKDIASFKDLLKNQNLTLRLSGDYYSGVNRIFSMFLRDKDAFTPSLSEAAALRETNPRLHRLLFPNIYRDLDSSRD
jgi:hypothetical protein